MSCVLLLSDFGQIKAGKRRDEGGVEHYLCERCSQGTQCELYQDKAKRTVIEGLEKWWVRRSCPSSDTLFSTVKWMELTESWCLLYTTATEGMGDWAQWTDTSKHSNRMQRNTTLPTNGKSTLLVIYKNCQETSNELNHLQWIMRWYQTLFETLSPKNGPSKIIQLLKWTLKYSCFKVLWTPASPYSYCSLQKQSCYFSKVFGYYSCVTILTMQILWM